MSESKELIKQANKQLIERYPYLLPRNPFTDEPSQTYDYSYVLGEYDLPKGWFKLFLQMCEDIRKPLDNINYLEKFRFTQIKEKYGKLCVYTHGATHQVTDIISKYEFLSQQICCVCGEPATIRTYGYICPYCTEHVKDSMECIEDAEIINPQTSYIETTWTAGHKRERSVSVKDEWNRYLERIGYKDETRTISTS
jgi:hypothetical protein